MATTQEAPNLEIYTEMTPNPDSLKFVMNQLLLPNQSADYRDPESAKSSPLAQELFEYPFVAGVFINNNFVSITKNEEQEWEEVIPQVKLFLKEYVQAGKPVIDEEAPETESGNKVNESDDETVARIKQMLENYVKPAVEMDGGAIQFQSFENGVLTLELQGSCSGCPSSMVTLKQGIESMMQRMVPQVEKVEAQEG
jgi:Fe-S cluster biogenesis protein NfuA